MYIIDIHACTVMLLFNAHSPSPVSMAIHRVGETLLIDEFAAPMNLPTGVCELIRTLYITQALVLSIYWRVGGFESHLRQLIFPRLQWNL